MDRDLTALRRSQAHQLGFAVQMCTGSAYNATRLRPPGGLRPATVNPRGSAPCPERPDGTPGTALSSRRCAT
ncbi:DUF4158 domain-containing protein (plasmid) [Streptomyces longhuiensis]|nr:DUF4158 domain-containing protein [Streptomyces longhuiensis]UDM05442.1 DUF4158 domain-containing protein [Streptomyces longhuiensis]